MKGMTSRVFKRIRSRISRNGKDGRVDLKSGTGTIDYSGPFTKDDFWVSQPKFREVSPENRMALLIKHLRMCSVIFDFNDESSKENLGKEMKRQLLLAVVDHITTTKEWFSEIVCQEILNMVAANLFRDLPPSPSSDFDPEEDDPALDPAWPHLQIVYEFLLRFMVSTYTDAKLLKKHMSKTFLVKLIGLFRSEDPRERDYLKTILHRVYGKFMSFRSFIRSTVNNVFFNFVYETNLHSGISELLEILGSIINGFAVPLKKEHRRFLRRVLIPLHKAKTLGQFHQQLAYCSTQFIEKDPKLGCEVIQGLLTFWPVQSSSKEILFLNELDEILEITDKTEIHKIITPLFVQISKCLNSPHFQIAERSLFLWNNDAVASFTSDYNHEILPILYPSLAKNSKHHWNQTVQSLTFNVIRMFMDIDSALFDKVCKEYDERFQREQKENKAREEFWSQYTVAHAN